MPDKLCMGVYRLYSEQGQHSYVGYSRNLAATRKRLLFELKLNACPYKHLQEYYNACKGLLFENLEEYVPAQGESELEIDAHLMAMLHKHKAAQNAFVIQL